MITVNLSLKWEFKSHKKLYKVCPECGGAVVLWLARWTSDLEVGSSSLVTAIVLFP